MSHTHEFLDVSKYLFEDVLVTEMLHCEGRHCGFKKPTQYEVDFTSFKQDGDSVSESVAEDCWDRICMEVGTDYSISREKPFKGGLEVTTRDGIVITVEYDGTYDDREIEAVVVEFSDTTIEFAVEFYRELQPKER